MEWLLAYTWLALLLMMATISIYIFPLSVLFLNKFFPRAFSTATLNSTSHLMLQWKAPSLFLISLFSFCTTFYFGSFCAYTRGNFLACRFHTVQLAKAFNVGVLESYAQERNAFVRLLSVSTFFASNVLEFSHQWSKAAATTRLLLFNEEIFL